MNHAFGRQLAIGVTLGMLVVPIATSGPGEASSPDVVSDLPDVPAVAIGADLTPAQLEDIGTVAQEHGMSLQEAIARYGWQESFAMLVDDIRITHPDSYAGARIDPSGDPWIAFKGDVPEAALTVVMAFDAQVFSSSAVGPFAGSVYEIDVISNRGYSEAELDELLVAAHYAAIAEVDLVANASSGYDIATGIVTVEVEPNASLPPQILNDIAVELRARSGAFDGVSISVVDDIKLGDAHIYGGDAMSTCTSGFTVKKGSTRGIATAGHCGNSQSMGGLSLTFQGEYDGYWGDVQWHTGSHYEYDDFYSGSSSDYDVNKRDVGSLGTAVEGQSLCRNGKTTFKECDDVYQLNHCSWDTCHLTMMHNMEASGGDSGGPWFWGTKAYGLHQGWKFWNFKFRDVFTPQGYIDDGLPGVYITTS